MDEFSNGKIEETDKVETEVKKDEKLVIEDAQEPKPEAESEFVREIIESLKGSYFEDNAEEKEEAKEESSSIMEGLELEELQEEEEEEEKEIINSIVDTDELIVEIPVDSDAIEVESEGIGETEIKTSKGIDEIPRTRGIESKGTDEKEVDPEGFNVELLLNGARETMWPESTPNKPNGTESEVAGLSETEDEISPFRSVDNDASSEGILEKEVVSPLNENSSGLTRGIEEIKVEENAQTGENESSVKNIEDDDSSKPSPNAIIVGSNDAFPETNPNVISISQRTVQPTTWRSCCGLFQVLKGSKR